MNKRVLLAFTTFKDSMSAVEVCNVVEGKLLEIDSSLKITKIPLSDGGEGFLHTVENAFCGIEGSQFRYGRLEAIDPLGNMRNAEYGILEMNGDSIGVIEMAAMSGIEFVPFENRHPNFTTSHGTGQAILHLYSHENIRKILLGIGGSATVDAGISLLYALNCLEFEFEGGNPEFVTGKDLRRLKQILLSENSEILQELEITIACDVNNPLLGPRGATYVFGPQKGLKQDELEYYEETIKIISEKLKEIKNKDDIDVFPGSGAAGGIAAGLKSCFNKVKIEKGIDMIAETLRLNEIIQDFDYVFTGEGRYDQQTAGGKPVSKIKELVTNPIIICGMNSSEETFRVYDLASRFGKEHSMKNTKQCLELITQEIYENEIRPY
ncbi:unnamed protein product [Blepharisma stoltei]|uniref:Glycerate kinase n=1 Tax=Blepharisma stoltei TaxID=1481888 RepID=A0AAU9II37_9CILI|nr:unnamed protein product [Blepharisma stoltei]